MAHKFLVHAKQDTVGVAVEPIHAGETVGGVVLDDDSTLTITAAQDIPLGHKIALGEVPLRATVVKYGEPIGITTAPIAPGQHVHTHNLKSARW